MATRTTKSSPKETPKKTTKRTTPVKKATKAEATVATPVKNESPKVTRPSFKIKRSYVLAGIAALLLLGALYLLRNYFIVATVNGQPITRLEYSKELERLSGKQAMNSIVTKTLILQEAKKQNVSVTNEEIDNEIKKIETNLQAQGQKLDSVLTLQGLTRESLREQISLQKLIEKMVGKDIKVTDKEIDDYITANQASLPQETKPEELRKQVSEQLRQQKLNDKVQEWLQKLQQDAKVSYSTPQE